MHIKYDTVGFMGLKRILKQYVLSSFCNYLVLKQHFLSTVLTLCRSPFVHSQQIVCSKPSQTYLKLNLTVTQKVAKCHLNSKELMWNMM